ncbi:alpha/beta fold hydrolase [Novosphingobium album (ex Liu et al. 2023)]|uniref:alpha/beta fold hydrolase n=1 Tax=Novosphingobium album (ex Liu et al. 2023) TaxID=3031130 RepID=UPI003D179DEE
MRSRGISNSLRAALSSALLRYCRWLQTRLCPGVTKRSIVAEGANIHYPVAGKGPPILLFHGWACSASSWRGQVRHLAGHGFRVIALDLPGHGKKCCAWRLFDRGIRQSRRSRSQRCRGRSSPFGRT